MFLAACENVIAADARAIQSSAQEAPMALAVCFLSRRPNSPLLQISDLERRKEGKILDLQSIVFPLHHQTWLSS